MLTVKQMEKECRSEAKNNGLTFKKHSHCIVNGRPVYKYIHRGSGLEYRSMLTIDTAWEIACSGELDMCKEN